MFCITQCTVFKWREAYSGCTEVSGVTMGQWQMFFMTHTSDRRAAYQNFSWANSWPLNIIIITVQCTSAYYIYVSKVLVLTPTCMIRPLLSRFNKKTKNFCIVFCLLGQKPTFTTKAEPSPCIYHYIDRCSRGSVIFPWFHVYNSWIILTAPQMFFSHLF